MELVYVGPHDGVDVLPPDVDIPIVTAMRHVPVEVPEAIAAGLLLQPTNWQRSPKRAEKTGPTKPGKE